MNITLTGDTQNVDWAAVLSLLKTSGMATYAEALHKKAFENSHRTAFLYDGETLIGCGRLLADGAYQGAIYDVAVSSDYRGAGLGRRILEHLLDGTEQMNILLYATPGRETFYEKFGFRRTKTGMARFVNPGAMEQKGFIE